VAEDRDQRPTAKRLQDARRRGQVLRSRDVHDALQLGGVLVALAFCGRPLVEGLGQTVAAGIVAVGGSAHRTITETEISGLAMETAKALVILVGPISGLALVTGVFSTLLVGGFNISTEPLTINFNKMNPANGLARLKPSKAGLDLLRTLVALIVMAWIAKRSIDAMVLDTLTLGRVMPAQAASIAWDVADGFLRRAWVVLAVLAGADYGMQYYRYMKGLRMTKQEVKDEHKMSDGSPEIKARIRKTQRDLLRRRMLAAVPAATVVVTNPTHVAVALEYKRAQMFAPKVVAKGADHMAERIKKVAREHNVPVVENVALARALYANTEIGDTIPGDLFEAVAEVLAYLIKLKQLVF
jgi:flagellar biosynthetic protein FlhB